MSTELAIVPVTDLGEGIVLGALTETDLAAWVGIQQLDANDVEMALRVTVQSNEDLAQMVEIGKTLKDRRKAIVEFFKPIKQTMDGRKRCVLDLEKKVLEAYELIDEHFNTMATAYRIEQNRIAKVAADAEAARKLREAEDDRIRRAEEATAKGATKLADMLISTPIAPPKVDTKPAVPKGFAGTKALTHWKFEINNPESVPAEFCSPDPAKIREYVNKKKTAAIGAIAGVRVWSEDSTSW